jgi:peptide chain release factor 2
VSPFDLPALRQQEAALEAKLAGPDFWSDQRSAQAVVSQLGRVKGRLGRYAGLAARFEDLQVLIELAGEGEGDQELLREAQRDLGAVGRDLEQFRLELLLQGEYDGRNAILTLHAGAGGIEAQDWVEMLLRMYTRWTQQHGFEADLLDTLEGEEAGLKSATFAVRGDYAYGFLRTERGVHRLVRISPFDAQSRRHTTFASLDVTPETEDQVEVDVRPDELKVETFRASGKGGQHVNKTDSAVRITHLPTGITASCQDERSQHSNRATAMRILMSRLLKLREQQKEQEMAALKGEQREISWGNQIRSYVFQPYTLVKDHRTEVETGNVQAVMNGELDRFIFAYLRQDAARRRPGKES